MTYFRRYILQNNSDPKPEKIIKEKKKYSFKKKPTGEKELFLTIWDSRPHYCQICFSPIPEASTSNFMHVLAKGLNKYPKFKLNPENLILACSDCHHIWDNARHKTTKEFDFVYKLEAKLKEDYKKL
jgi:5-methylcytosine-specific restriction endonuclease McrA